MSEIKVALNGLPLLTWEGDLPELDSVEAYLMPGLEHGAAESGIPGTGAKDMLYNVVRHLSDNGHFTTNESWLEQQCVVSYLLSRPTTHPKYPGQYRDYIPVWDFSFDIKSTPGGFEIETLAGCNNGRKEHIFQNQRLQLRRYGGRLH
jgi:hypothetical protein